MYCCDQKGESKLLNETIRLLIDCPSSNIQIFINLNVISFLSFENWKKCSYLNSDDDDISNGLSDDSKSSEMDKYLDEAMESDEDPNGYDMIQNRNRSGGKESVSEYTLKK